METQTTAKGNNGSATPSGAQGGAETPATAAIKAVSVAAATGGRGLKPAHLERLKESLAGVQVVVLDEADRLMDGGGMLLQVCVCCGVG